MDLHGHNLNDITSVNLNKGKRGNYDEIYNNRFKLDYKVKDSLIIENYLESLMIQ